MNKRPVFALLFQYIFILNQTYNQMNSEHQESQEAGRRPVQNIMILDDVEVQHSPQRQPRNQQAVGRSSNIQIIDDCGEDEASQEQSKSSDRHERHPEQRRPEQIRLAWPEMGQGTMHTAISTQPQILTVKESQGLRPAQGEGQEPSIAHSPGHLVNSLSLADPSFATRGLLRSPGPQDRNEGQPYQGQIMSPEALSRDYASHATSRSPLGPSTHLTNSNSKPASVALHQSSGSRVVSQLNLQSARSLYNLNDSLSIIAALGNASAQRPTGAGGNVTLLSPTSSTNDYQVVNELRRDLRKKEQEFGKERAVLKQQVQLLELQTKEHQLREDQMKQLHQTMLSAVQESRSEKASPGGTSNEQQLREENEEQLTQHAKSIQRLNEQLRHQEFDTKNMLIQMEEQQIEHERKTQELVLDKRNLDNQIKRLQYQIQQSTSQEELDLQVQSGREEVLALKAKLQQKNLQHKSELEKRDIFSQELEAQRVLMNQQIDFLKSQLAQKDEQRELQSRETLSLEEQIKAFERQQEEMEAQIDELTDQLQRKDNEVLQLQQSLDFNSSFEFTYNKGGAGGNSERSINLQVQRLFDENEYLTSQIQSHLTTIEEQKQQISKYQNMENQSQAEMDQTNAQLIMLEKQHESTLRNLEEDYRNKLEVAHQSSEHDKSELEEMKSQIFSFKRQFEEQQNIYGQQVKERDTEIERLSQIIASLHQLQFQPENRSSMEHSPIRHDLSTLLASRDFQLTVQGMQSSQQDHGQMSKLLRNQNVSQLSGTDAGLLGAGALQTVSHNEASAQAQENLAGPAENGFPLKSSGQKLVQLTSCLELGNDINTNQTLNLNMSNQFSQFDQNFQTTESQILNLPAGVASQENHHIDNANDQQPSERADSEDKVQIPLSEFDLLQSCQKIIDAAFSMKCIQCEKIFQTTDFYDHIIVQQECVIESEQESQSHQPIQIINTDGHIMDSNYFDDLNNLNNTADHGNARAVPQMETLDSSHQNMMKSSLLKSMEDGDGFYEALNMPLQTNVDSINYQTQNKDEDMQKIEVKLEKQERNSSPIYEKGQIDQSDSKNNYDPRDPHLMISNQKHTTRESRATKTKRTNNQAIDIRTLSGGNLGGNNCSRSGMGASGTALTINSHILMSLSRSSTSRSRRSDDSLSSNQQQIEAAASRVNLNFKNEQDNICNLAINYKLLTDEYNQNAISEESKTNVKSTARERDQAPQVENGFQDHEIKNYLTNTTLENTKSQIPSQRPTNRGQAMQQVVLDLDILEESKHHNHIGLEEINSQEDLSKSEEGLEQPPEPQANLERLYDLDTSRFDEEFLNLPSSKKKQLLDQIEHNSSSQQNREEMKVAESFTGGMAQHQHSSSEQISNFVDMSRFNNSHELPQNQHHESFRKAYNISEQSLNAGVRDRSSNQVKVVGINLVPVIKEGRRRSENKSSMDMNDFSKQERSRDMPISLKEVNKQRIKHVPGTSMGMITQANNTVSNLNFFAKPSPKFQDDDITQNLRGNDAALRHQLEGQGILQTENAYAYAQMGGGYSIRPSSSGGVGLNTSKLSGFENSMMSQNRIKFDLSKQIDQINKQKLAKEKTFSRPAGTHLKPDLQKAKSQTSLKTMIKKPILNIEIEDDYLNEEDENLNMPMKIEGLGIEAQLNQQNVMESFRKYQHRKQLQAQGSLALPVIDVNQQFQSVSSKNGTQNFDFGALTGSRSAKGKNFQSNPGIQPSSRRHAHGTNRYNKNGFMMVTSSSMDSNSAKEGESQADARNQDTRLQPAGSKQSRDYSPLPSAPENQYEMIENKTIEQNERIHQKLGQLGSNQGRYTALQKKAGLGIKQSNPAESKRIDTSGFDLDINSPYNVGNRIQVPSNNQVKPMEGIAHRPQSEDLSQTATIEHSSEEDEQERNDEIKELIEQEQANQFEAGFQSHRHYLGKERGFKPQLMSDQETRMQELQQTIRDPAMMTNSEKQIMKLRQALLSSQYSNEQREVDLAYQGTHMTEFQNQLLQTKYSCNLQALKNANPANRRSSPKNSDYIKQSILMSAGKSTKRYQMPRQQVAPGQNTYNQRPQPRHEVKLVPAESEDEDCNSFIDEMEFDEDHPMLDMQQQQVNDKQFQSTAPAPQQKLSTFDASERPHGSRPVTQKNLTTCRDPLKNSLFHSFMQTQPGKKQQLQPESTSNQSYLKSFRDNLEEQDMQLLNQFNSQQRSAQAQQLVNAFSARSRQQASLLSSLPQQTSYQSQGTKLDQPIDVGERQPGANTGYPFGNPVGPGSQLHSNLQKHMANTGQLLRSRSNTKKQNIDALAVNQSVGIIHRPMMSSLNPALFSPSPAQNNSFLQHCPSAGSLQAAVASANHSGGVQLARVPSVKHAKPGSLNLPRKMGK